MKKTNKKGFTLVELVIVIAVLLILAAVAIPTVSGVIDRANEATDTANAKNIETAIKYALAYNQTNGNADDVTTVGGALTLSGLDASILTPKQSGKVFVYTSGTNTVTVDDGADHLDAADTISKQA